MLYPLKFKPIYKSPLWGGSRIAELPGRKGVPETCGESWEISTVENNISVVSEGALKGNSLEELIEIYMGELVGEKIYSEFGLHFPLLVKIIDANSDLSVQVHPDDEYAYNNHHSIGKTEMWYVMQAGENSTIINGFNKETTGEEVQDFINREKLPEILNTIPARAGDIHFIPSGRVHAIGSGVMLAEIQQSSDITYRLYDWGRKDEKGQGRELHIPQALDVLDFSSEYSFHHPVTETNRTVCIAQCDYFTANIIDVKEKLICDYSDLDSFVIIMNTSGKCSIKSPESDYTVLQTGETVLIPAGFDEIEIVTDSFCTLLECYIE